MWSRGKLRLKFRDGFGFVSGPVDLTRFQVVQINVADRWLLIDQRVLRIVSPVVRRGDDDAMLERLLPGGGEEAVDVAFLDGVVFRVELALDGVEFACPSGACDEVDAGVGFADAKFVGHVGEHPDVAVEVGVGGLIAEVDADELFEVGAFFTFSDGGDSVGGE